MTFLSKVTTHKFIAYKEFEIQSVIQCSLT